MREVRISIYFMWEWWEKYFHCMFKRPEKACDDSLEWMYLMRKKFLFENFGEFGVGEERPVMDGRYVNMVLKWGMDFIPYVLGAKLTCQDVGGYAAEKMDIETIKALKPVNVADSPAGEWIIKRKEELIKRYGSADQGMDLEGPTNIAVRIRGEDFYIDLIEDKGLARHILDVVTETIISGYLFFGKQFKMNELLIADCNVTLISPSLYEEIILDYDIKVANISKVVTGREKAVRLHHCDVPVDKFIYAYKKIPEVYKIEASYTSDIAMVLREMPDTCFSAMINPLDLMRESYGVIEQRIGRALEKGAVELDIWNIDPSVDISKMRKIFSLVQRCCERNNCRALFDCIPFCWDELEWAFPRYQRQLGHV